MLNSIALSFLVIVFAHLCLSTSIGDIFNPKSTQKYSKTKIDDQHSAEIYSQVNELLSTQEVYSCAELKIDDIALKTGFSKHNISQAISMSDDKNFMYMLNRIRISKVSELLKDPNFKDTDIITLAFNCGFNSKSTFNRAFKSLHGVTPSRFRATSQ